MQCFDRTHRMGQTRDVTIYKFITKDSIEEKMLEIQAKKEGLISGDCFGIAPSPLVDLFRRETPSFQDDFVGVDDAFANGGIKVNLIVLHISTIWVRKFSSFRG